MTASAMRAIGPAASTSLFAFSVSHNLAGGALGWFALAASALASLICASSLSDPDVQELVAREEDGIGRE